MLRYSRKFSSNQVPNSRINRWKKNLTNSVFYSKVLGEGEIFPIMNKAKFMANFDTINTVNIKKGEALSVAIKSEKTRDFSPMIGNISVGLSSGTSGNKGIFLTSKREKEIWVAAILDRVIGFSFKKRKVAFFLRANNNLYESVKSKFIAFQFFDTKLGVSAQFSQLDRLEADILVAQPSVLFEIAKQYERTAKQPVFKKIISVAEVLETDQKVYFEKIFKQRIDQIYQCTEGFLAYTCAKGNMHFNEDLIKIEKKYLDESHSRFHPIITDYMRSSQPVIRYELNDIIHEGKPCTCGSKSTVIKRIEGRSDDVFKFIEAEKEITIYPDFMRRAVLLHSDLVTNYMISRKAEKLIEVYLEVKINTELTIAFQKVKQGLNQLFEEFGIKGIKIIQADYHHNPMLKFRRIKNEYTKSI